LLCPLFSTAFCALISTHQTIAELEQLRVKSVDAETAAAARLADLQAKLAAAEDALQKATAAWETEKKELYDEMDERLRAHKSVVAEKQAQQSSYDEAAAAAASERARIAAEKERELFAAHESLALKSAAHDELQAKLAAAAAELQTAQQIIAAKTNELQTAEQTIVTLRAELAAKSARCDELRCDQ
jgi:hypothetical protein